MSVRAAGGPLTPGGVEGTRDSIPWLRGGSWRTRSEPREAQDTHKSAQPSCAASRILTRGARRPGNDSTPPRPAGGTVIGYLPHGLAHRTQSSRPYLRALVRAPEGSPAGAGGLSCCYLTLAGVPTFPVRLPISTSGFPGSLVEPACGPGARGQLGR